MPSVMAPELLGLRIKTLIFGGVAISNVTYETKREGKKTENTQELSDFFKINRKEIDMRRNM